MALQIKRQLGENKHHLDSNSEASTSKWTLSSEPDLKQESRQSHLLSKNVDADVSFAEPSTWGFRDPSSLLQPLAIPNSPDDRKAFSEFSHDSHSGRSRKHKHGDPLIGSSSSSHTHSDRHASRWHTVEGSAIRPVTTGEEKMKSLSWPAAAVASLSLVTSSTVASIGASMASATASTLDAGASVEGREALASTFDQAQQQMVLMKRQQ